MKQILMGETLPNRPNFKPKLIVKGLISYNNNTKGYELTTLGKEVLSQELMKKSL